MNHNPVVNSNGIVTTPQALRGHRGKGRDKGGNMSKSSVSGQPWLVVDVIGLRKTLQRKGKAFAIYELLQNGFDEDSTKVSVTLTKPVDGKSTLICVDDAPRGYVDLSNAHTMFAESKKKTDHTKRGRFNIGEKLVLALCDEATITSTTGRVIFYKNGTRSHDKVKTKVGTEFRGELSLTDEEFNDLSIQVNRVIPPIPTFFNGIEIPTRKTLHEFTTTLPTEIADDNGVSRSRQRETNVRLYIPLDGEKPTLYELGMPVVEMDCKWHVDVQQKVPLNIERDNVTPSYLRTLRVAIVNECKEYLTEEDAAAAWVNDALSSPDIEPTAVQTVITQRFGKNAVLYDGSDIGSNRECVADDIPVIPRGTFTKEQRANVAKVIKKASDIHPTNDNSPLNNIIPPDKLVDAQSVYKKFISDVAPLMLDHKLEAIEFIDDPDSEIYGCTKWMKAEKYIFVVNVAYQNVEDWQQNYDLLIHELAHHAVQRNDHLFEGFWRAASEMGAKLVQIALTHPHLFPPEALEKMKEVAEKAA
jgi:Histidine kinase-, DNA gyrase B-, and HSP90-like ATPase